MAALGVRTEKLRLNRHFVNGVLLITFVLACTISVDGKKLYEFLAVTKVDGLSPAPSWFFLPTVSYGAPASKIFRALGAILLSKDLQEPTLRRHPKNAFLCVILLSCSGVFKLNF